MEIPINFIIVDDDKTNNMLCKAVIKKTFENSNVILFQCPEESLVFIRNEYCKSKTPTPTVLFLDINMPGMSGWEFLEEFKNFPEEAKQQIKIFILSSSIDNNDMQRAADNELVSDYVQKPLRRDSLKTLIEDA